MVGCQKRAARPGNARLQANVTDFEALIKAVAYGQAPVTLLLVNWEALDAMVAAQGANFSMAGVTLRKAAA